MIKNKPLILVVNDDGFFSPGIQFLISVMREIGEVFVIAPDSNRSGVSHGMTLHEDIYIKKINNKLNEFICSGTPVDCVKIGVNKILPRLPDLCVSGINHGSNHSINSLYSGTLHCALEGAIQGVPSISFSHLRYSDKINFTPFHKFIKIVSMDVLNNKFPKDIVLNVNFPDVDSSKIKGAKICTQGKGKWTEKFKQTKTEKDKTFYSIKGDFRYDTTEKDTDSWALVNNFISIVPININCSDNNAFKMLKKIEYFF